MKIVRTVGFGPDGPTVNEEIELGDARKQTLDAVIPKQTDGVEVQFACDLALVKYLFVHSTGAVTMKTNSADTPDDTKSLAAGCVFDWRSVSGIDCPLNGDEGIIRSLFFDNLGLQAATVQIRCFEDSTPV